MTFPIQLLLLHPGHQQRHHTHTNAFGESLMILAWPTIDVVHNPVARRITKENCVHWKREKGRSLSLPYPYLVVDL